MTEIVKSFIPDDAMLFTYRELAGFYDVDGSFFTKIKHTPTQNYYEMLRMIQKSFGGPMTKRNVSNLTKSERNRYMSTIHTMEVSVLVPNIKDHLVLKGKSLDVTKEYVRGVFCAVGCLKTFGLTIQHERIDGIKGFVEQDLGVPLGKVIGHEWSILDHQGMKTFLDWMTLGLPRLFNEDKAAKIDAFYTYLETKDPVGMKRDFVMVTDDVLKMYTDITREYITNLRAVVILRQMRLMSMRV